MRDKIPEEISTCKYIVPVWFHTKLLSLRNKTNGVVMIFSKYHIYTPPKSMLFHRISVMPHWTHTSRRRRRRQEITKHQIKTWNVLRHQKHLLFAMWSSDWWTENPPRRIERPNKMEFVNLLACISASTERVKLAFQNSNLRILEMCKLSSEARSITVINGMQIRYLW